GSGELQESICRNKTTTYSLYAIPLPCGGDARQGRGGCRLVAAPACSS
ncbi:hypothetical protein GOA77_23085, partial [Sinorhizobium meliloti]|nr:hypothetical protein [Sinorhizobium meliloti]